MAGSARDTYKYDFVNSQGRILHSGITNNLQVREREHRRHYEGKGRIVQVGRRTTSNAARKWETRTRALEDIAGVFVEVYGPALEELGDK